MEHSSPHGCIPANTPFAVVESKISTVLFVPALPATAAPRVLANCGGGGGGGGGGDGGDGGGGDGGDGGGELCRSMIQH